MALMVTSAWALDFSVDASELVSHAHPLNGVNDGPGHVRGAISDVSDQYREMGITMVRTHDYYGPCDYSTIFPSSYEPNDPWGADAGRCTGWRWLEHGGRRGHAHVHGALAVELYGQAVAFLPERA